MAKDTKPKKAPEPEPFTPEWYRKLAREDAAAEEAYEMRAAFGPGEEIVNIFTGKRYYT